ncbi:transcriptional regulator EutR [compost metagenome]
MAPTQWLRLRRLNSARRELLSRTHLQSTVAEVAMRWSFWHLGRFSSSYRALFKELPSDTLKRAGVAQAIGRGRLQNVGGVITQITTASTSPGLP